MNRETRAFIWGLILITAASLSVGMTFLKYKIGIDLRWIDAVYVISSCYVMFLGYKKVSKVTKL